VSTNAVPASPLRTGCAWLFSGGALILASVVIFLVGLVGAWQEYTFQNDNAAASAKITGQGVHHNPAGKGTTTIYFVNCQWTLDGKSQSAEVEVSKEFCDNAVVGQAIDIQYRKSNPTDARLAGTTKWLLVSICFALSLVSLWLGRYLISWNRRRQKQ
jgi:type III secretory pathway component EscS